jgi:hypothetical protein
VHAQLWPTSAFETWKNAPLLLRRGLVLQSGQQKKDAG